MIERLNNVKNECTCARVREFEFPIVAVVVIAKAYVCYMSFVYLFSLEPNSVSLQCTKRINK